MTEFIDGQTLTQWMIDNPKPDLATVRDIVEQIARGLRAFHRKEMLHQDTRPDNIMIDKTGTAKIIDFGSTKITGVVEAAPPWRIMISSAQRNTRRRSISLERAARRVPTYVILARRDHLSDADGRKLPYGAQVAKARTRSQFNKLKYNSALDDKSEIPAWIDGALRKAVHPDPYKRYESLSEFTFDLRQPNARYLDTTATPLLERNPILFWKCTTAMLAVIIVVLLAIQHVTSH